MRSPGKQRAWDRAAEAVRDLNALFGRDRFELVELPQQMHTTRMFLRVIDREAPDPDENALITFGDSNDIIVRILYVIDGIKLARGEAK